MRNSIFITHFYWGEVGNINLFQSGPSTMTKRVKASAAVAMRRQRTGGYTTIKKTKQSNNNNNN